MLRKYFAVFLTILIVLGYIIIQKSPLVKQESFNAPVISIDVPAIEVSVTTNKEEFLQGISAYDQEDGDLTNQIRIESITPGNGENVNVVNYIVFDQDGHIGRASKQIVYIDYQAPYFKLLDDLNGSKYSSSAVLNKVRAYSSIDGDISKNITIMNAEILDSSTISVRLKVSDSTLSTAYLTAKYRIEEDSAIDIQLNDYLIYMNLGDPLDLMANIQNIKVEGKETTWLNHLVTLETPEITKPGVYEVTYHIQYNEQVGKKVILLVVGGGENA